MTHPHTARRLVPIQLTFYRVATALVVVAILYFAQVVLVPFALAVLIAFALTPVADRVERQGLGRVPASLLVAAAALALVGGVGWLAASQAQSLAAHFGEYKDNIVHKLEPVLNAARALDSLQEVTGGEKKQPPSSEVVVEPHGSNALNWLPTIARPLVTAAATALLVAVMTVFILVQRDTLRDRLIGLAGRGQLTSTTRALGDAARRVSRYLLLQTVTNSIMGLGVAGGLYLIGVPYAFLWGLLAALLRFLPYIGIWASALFPFTLAMGTHPQWWPAVLVLVLYGGLDLVMSNAVEPTLFGHGIGASPLALLVAAVFWAWLWGPVGLLLAIPMTVCLVVLGEHVPSLRFLKTMFGAAPKVDPADRLFHRLLARDVDEAAVILEEEVKAQPLSGLYDHVILPALAEAKTERERGDLSAAEARGVYRTVRELLDGVLAGCRVMQPPAGKPQVRVVGCSARGEADALALILLRDVLIPAGGDLTAVPFDRVPGEVDTRAAAGERVVVVIAAVSPGGLAQAAGLCRLLKGKKKDVRVLVGRWGTTGDTSEAEKYLTAGGADKVTWSLADTVTELIPGYTTPPAAAGCAAEPAHPTAHAVTVPA